MCSENVLVVDFNIVSLNMDTEGEMAQETPWSPLRYASANSKNKILTNQKTSAPERTRSVALNLPFDLYSWVWTAYSQTHALLLRSRALITAASPACRRLVSLPSDLLVVVVLLALLHPVQSSGGRVRSAAEGLHVLRDGPINPSEKLNQIIEPGIQTLMIFQGDMLALDVRAFIDHVTAHVIEVTFP